MALVRFSAGVEFTFPVGAVLAPGERILVVRSAGVFESIHGTGHPVSGEFQLDGALDNSGDHLVLEAADGSVILDFSYNDKPPWPTTPDGGGDSLVLIDPFSNPDHGDPANWRSSVSQDGNPGTGDRVPFAGGPTDDLDQDGIPALVEHVLGQSDLVTDDQGSILTWSHGPVTGTDLFVTRSLVAEDVALEIEFSDDLVTWTVVLGPPSLDEHLSHGLARHRWHLDAPQSAARFFRLRADLR